MATVKAMTITVDILLPRLKLDCNVGYDASVKGVSVVVNQNVCHITIRDRCTKNSRT